jgi:SMODS-associating 2TM, beta-strand rich effector domain
MMDTKTYLKALFWLAVGSWAICLFLYGEPLTMAFLKPASLVQSVLIAAVTVFEKWGWRWPVFNVWVKRPDLIGCYRGELRSQWINPETKQGIPAIQSFIVIRQTLSDIHIRLFTEQSQSASLQGCITRQADGHQELLFSYRNEPTIEHRARSPIHYGGAKLQISHNTKTLEGSYWTDRATIGAMTFTRFSREMPSNFKEATELASRVGASSLSKIP